MNKSAAEHKRKQDAERKRIQRQRDKKNGIVPVSSRCHVDDKPSILEYIRRKNKKRGIE